MAVVIVPADQLILVGVGLGLDGVIENQHAVVLVNRANRGLNLLPQRLGIIAGLRQKARHPVRADLTLQQCPAPWPWSPQRN